MWNPAFTDLPHNGRYMDSFPVRVKVRAFRNPAE
jgi:hypothetical protein